MAVLRGSSLPSCPNTVLPDTAGAGLAATGCRKVPQCHSPKPPDPPSPEALWLPRSTWTPPRPGGTGLAPSSSSSRYGAGVCLYGGIPLVADTPLSSVPSLPGPGATPTYGQAEPGSSPQPLRHAEALPSSSGGAGQGPPGSPRSKAGGHTGTPEAFLCAQPQRSATVGVCWVALVTAAAAGGRVPSAVRWHEGGGESPLPPSPGPTPPLGSARACWVV